MGLPDMIINHLEAYVSCSGQRLPEYARTQALHDSDTKVCNIESRDGQEFTIRVKDLEPRRDRHQAMWVKVFAEGRLLVEEGMLREDNLHIRSAEDEHGVRRKFQFTAPRFIESDDVESEGFLDQVGLLEIIVYPAKFTTRKYKKQKKKAPSKAALATTKTSSEAQLPFTDDSMELDKIDADTNGVLTERSKKQGFNVVTLGAPVHSRTKPIGRQSTSGTAQTDAPMSTSNDNGSDSERSDSDYGATDDEGYQYFTYYTCSDTEHLACFRFRHKSRERLQAAGLIPVSPRSEESHLGGPYSDGEDDGMSVPPMDDRYDDGSLLPGPSEEFTSISRQGSAVVHSTVSDVQASTISNTADEGPAPLVDAMGSGPPRKTPPNSSSPLSYKHLAFDEISVIVGDARSLVTSFRWPPFFDHAPSGDLISGTRNNTPVLAYKESLVKFQLHLDGIASYGDSEIIGRRKAAVVEIEAALKACDKRIQLMKELYLKRNAQSPTPAASAPTHLSVPSRPSTEGTNMSFSDDLSTATAASVSSPSPLVTSSPVTPSGLDNGVTGTKRKRDASDVGVKAEPQEDVKPVIKPDPDEQARSVKAKRGPSLKLQELLARQAVERSQLALSQTDLAVIKELQAEEDRKRSHAIDLTLDDD